MNTSPSFDIAQFFNRIRQLEIHTPQGLSGLLTKDKRKTYPTRAELVQYGQRSGYAGDEASAVLDRIENAYATVTVRCEKDARYQNDPLLSGIRQAVERPALKAHQAPRLG
ncbi:hypothetical protein [Candidatus Glomeribacter gigasporarum]|uniref:hypothetical protein n=1 Tax=Candidatus Glomeribacter gigasporarum TaxID=132144 RepID=UPI0002E440E5|nr:hypothetical protein [Candidatus Glomeribacter gigasporarum]